MPKDTESKIKSKNNGNGHDADKDAELNAAKLAALEEYKKRKEKETVPHAFNVLFDNEDEDRIDQVTRLNDREIMFMSVNGVRDDALLPRGGRPSISACLRMRIKRLKISSGGRGRDDVLAVSQLSEEEAQAAQGNSIGDRGV
jgi:hypothetical protein